MSPPAITAPPTPPITGQGSFFGAGEKFAVILRLQVMSTVVGLSVPEYPPPHPMNMQPGTGTASIDTTVPAANSLTYGYSAGLEPSILTIPIPSGLTFTVSLKLSPAQPAPAGPTGHRAATAATRSKTPVTRDDSVRVLFPIVSSLPVYSRFQRAPIFPAIQSARNGIRRFHHGGVSPSPCTIKECSHRPHRQDWYSRF